MTNPNSPVSKIQMDKQVQIKQQVQMYKQVQMQEQASQELLQGKVSEEKVHIS